ncbi:MAG: DUF115 domain-containing protein [Planctomycetota bacterium]|nr:MAG: DUF115 domain-containing protein [Planctomycetota bacterium]
MSQQRYERNIGILMQRQNAALRALFPQQWPSTAATCDRTATIQALRKVTATRNEGLLLIGWGDGQAVTLIRSDPGVAGKTLKVVIFPDEIENFAHSIGACDLQQLCSPGTTQFCFLSNYESAGPTIAASFYNDHNSISRLPGDRITSEHPLSNPQLEERRKAIVPQVSRLLGERLDMLGNDVYDTFMGANQSLQHGRDLVDLPRASDLKDLYQGKSAISIAAGPSGSRFLDQIKAIQNEHVIVCADVMLAGLLDRGIDPDFVTMVERPEHMKRFVADYAQHCTSRFVCQPWVHRHCTEAFADRVAWWWNPDDLYPWLDAHEPRLAAGRSTGTLAVALPAHLGCTEIFLVGHDLCLDNGKTHSDATHTTAVPENAGSRDAASYYRRIIDVPGNHADQVESTGAWSLFRQDIIGIIAGAHQRNPSQTFINTTINAGTGARIDGCVAGDLPTATGMPLEKISHPSFTPRDWEPLRSRARALLDDMDTIKSQCLRIADELADCTPLNIDNKRVIELSNKLDVTQMPSKENAIFFRYIFRAAMRNLMVRLQQNTYVRTLAERNWNQVQVMHHYAKSIPQLVDRLQPELEETLEVFQ